MSSKTFRVFVSSTFADLAEERNTLQNQVFPRLWEFCERQGARFSPVDLRWGVSAEAGEDQRTMSICLEEIRRCQQTTPRPNFIVLLAGRYGWQPLPAEVPLVDFERLQTTVSLKKSLNVFRRLYPSVDLNAVPGVYCLRHRTADIHADWDGLEQELLVAFQGACEELGWPFTERAKYGGSATEQEIVCGLLRNDIRSTSREHVHAFLLDTSDSISGSLDPEAHERLRGLKQRLQETLGANAHTYRIATGEGAGTTHTETLCQDVYINLERMIGTELARLAEVDPLDREIESHDSFASGRGRIFIGRAAVLRQIDDYLSNGDAKAFAVIGPSGSGKSAAMARALAASRRDYPQAAVVARFIGSTAESSSGVTLLDSLSRQIARIYGGAAPPVYAEYPRMAAVFRDSLKLARPEQPLILFLDALDQIPVSDAARNLSWLPLDAFPPNVRLVVSASSDSPGPAGVLQDKLAPARRAHLDPMPADEAGALLALWLADARRDLQPTQREVLITGFRGSGLPLYLRFAFEQGRLWPSFESPEPLGSDVFAIIRQTFGRLAESGNHGEMLVRRALGYLTAAKEGLTEEEMLDVLSADDVVMADFRNRFPKSPYADRLPLVIWSRLYYDLAPYLVERGGKSSAVLNYFHRQMREVAASDYLDTASERERHRALARYFGAKPNAFGGGVYHTRKLSELPYQQRKAGMWEDLEATLCDLSFIEAKCAAGLIYDLLVDYETAVLTAGLPEERKQRIASFGRFVRAQARLLSTHPHLTFQQALNQPDVTEPARSAALLASAERPRLRWINKPQRTSPCLLTLYGHTSYVNSCDASPDGRTIASASSDEEIKIWNANTGREELTLRGRPISVESCAFSADGTRIVSGTRDGQVVLWDAVSGGELWFVKVHDRPVPCCRFSADGKRIASASWDGRVKILDTATGAELLLLEGHGGDACWAEFSVDGSRLFSVGGDGKLKAWDTATGKELLSVTAHAHEIMTCRLSRDGTSIFTASQDTLVKRWDAATFELRNTYEGHEEGVWAAAVSPDGTRLVSGGRDGSIKLWDVESGAELDSMREHTNEIWGLAYFEDGSRFASAAWDGTVKIWDVKTAEEGSAAAGRPSKPESAEAGRFWGYMIACACAPDGSSFAAGSSDGSLRLWDAVTGLALGIFPLHRDFVFACAYSPDSRWIVSGAWDGALKIFDVRERVEAAAVTLPSTVVFCAFMDDGHSVAACCSKEIQVWAFADGKLAECVTWIADDPFSSCAVLRTTRQIIAGLESGRFLIWDVATRQIIGELPGHPGLIMFSVSPDGRFLAATSENGVAWIWDIPARVEVMTLQGHRERIVACNFSPDSRRLVTASWDRTARIWDLDAPAAPDRPIVLAGHTDQLQDCCFTPDGMRVLTAAVDGTVRIWDARSGTALGELLWPADAASLCAFAPNGKHVVTASSRNAIRVWSGDTGLPARVLSGHGDAVRACTFSRDGTLLTASADGTIRLWEVARDDAGAVIGRHAAPVSACAFSPDGSWAVSAAQDRLLKIWDVATASERASLEGHDDWVSLVRIAAAGSRIVSCSLDKTVRIWDSATGSLLHVLRGHATAICAAAVSPDTSRIVTGSEDGILFVWNVGSGEQEFVLSGHQGAIRACAFAGSIVSASRDGSLRLWNADTGRVQAELRGHTAPVQACAVSPDSRYLVSASEDRFIIIWEMVTGERRAEYWTGSPALSVDWAPDSRRIAAGDAIGNLHLLEFQGGASLRS